jgi:hypothetical protein
MAVDYFYNLPTPKGTMSSNELSKYVNDLYDALTQWSFDLASQYTVGYTEGNIDGGTAGSEYGAMFIVDGGGI